jgi:hypothetical protein
VASIGAQLMTADDWAEVSNDASKGKEAVSHAPGHHT